LFHTLDGDEMVRKALDRVVKGFKNTKLVWIACR